MKQTHLPPTGFASNNVKTVPWISFLTLPNQQKRKKIPKNLWQKLENWVELYNSSPQKTLVFCLVSVTVKFVVRVSVGFRTKDSRFHWVEKLKIAENCHAVLVMTASIIVPNLRLSTNKPSYGVTPLFNHSKIKTIFHLSVMSKIVWLCIALSALMTLGGSGFELNLSVGSEGFFKPTSQRQLRNNTIDE